ncbi:MAG: hypothetical protein KAH44_09145 [Oricola sp.]|nr:hypothetical protein [Oricola sp.]
MTVDFLRRLSLFAAGISLSVLAFSGTVATAGPSAPDHIREVHDFYVNNVEQWVNDPQVITAIREQNLRTFGMDQDAIIAADEKWRAEVGSDNADRPMVADVMNRDVSIFLKQKQRAADWMVVEIILMDAKGLNVGLSTPTSDYWQGDEAKHEKTFQAASHDLFIDEVEFEAEAGLLLSQVSQTIFDPDSGEPIGAVTVSVNMNKL